MPRVFQVVLRRGHVYAARLAFSERKGRTCSISLRSTFPNVVSWSLLNEKLPGFVIHTFAFACPSQRLWHAERLSEAI